MIVFQYIKDIKNYLSLLRLQHKKIGFVPTMGALHEGHLSIIRMSKHDNDVTVCSIFVNPTQFNNPEDFQKYPITTATDIDKLEFEKCDVLFLPAVKEMYPDGQQSDLSFDVGFFDNVMEGLYRPGHFKGVAQVVKRLIDIVEPDVLYLGQKDYQQYKVVEKLIHDLNLAVELRMAPTIREADGLAMSSRNLRLSQTGRMHAAKIYQILTKAALQLPSVPISIIKQESLQALRAIPGCVPEYFEIADAGTLQVTHSFKPGQLLLISTAAWLDGVRLIDNVVVKPH
jgi:pantoate--beta-alanine ligase